MTIRRTRGQARRVQQSTELRAQRVTRLLLEGYSDEAVAAQISIEYGVAQAQAARGELAAIRAAFTARFIGDIREAAALDLARLEELMIQNFALATQGSPAHIDRVLKIIKARGDILGYANGLPGLEYNRGMDVSITVRGGDAPPADVRRELVAAVIGNPELRRSMEMARRALGAGAPRAETQPESVIGAN